MKIKNLSIQNFRLLENVTLHVEEDITLIVGKNNTGKTSLFEVLKMFINEKNNFSFHDFSQNTYQQFKECLSVFNEIQKEENEEKKGELIASLNSSMPNISLEINVEYDKKNDSLVNISEFISDLDDEVHTVKIKLQYESKDNIRLFTSFINHKEKDQDLIEWLNENITSFYEVKCYGGENIIDDNFRKKLASVLCFETIQASRKLDDTKSDKNKTLAVGFSDYYREKNKENDTDVKNLEEKLKETSSVLNEKYQRILNEILNKLRLFGVEPHLTIPDIELQAGFDPESILRNNVRYYYKQDNITLPENFNGLGYSNLIYLVLKVVSFIEKFKSANSINKSETLTILIEEPEAHLHPQMQQVFISQIKRTVKAARNEDELSVQIIISTHSSHIVTEAGIDVERSFERIRYFSKPFNKKEKRHLVEVKDFNDFKYKESDTETFRFLKQYMSLHRCDIFFADKIILIEGITEKMLLPIMINKVDETLNNEYLSIIEVGGAYTIKFKELLKFLNIKSLLITDLDSIDPNDSRKSCAVDTPDAETSNSTLLNWLPGLKLVSDLTSCSDDEKFDSDLIRVAYQCKEDGDDYIARSLEEAIINRNKTFFNSNYEIDGVNTLVKSCFSLLKNEDLATTPYELAPKAGQKSDFAFDLMVFNESTSGLEWGVPKYIEEGLNWLAKNDI